MSLCFALVDTVAEQLGAQHGAVKMLYFRVRLIMDYLRGVQAGACEGGKSHCLSQGIL